eukprot:362909-Chlamydomonas_euryale.AAC.3
MAVVTSDRLFVIACCLSAVYIYCTMRARCGTTYVYVGQAVKNQAVKKAACSICNWWDPRVREHSRSAARWPSLAPLSLSLSLQPWLQTPTNNDQLVLSAQRDCRAWRVLALWRHCRHLLRLAGRCIGDALQQHGKVLVSACCRQVVRRMARVVLVGGVHTHGGQAPRDARDAGDRVERAHAVTPARRRDRLARNLLGGALWRRNRHARAPQDGVHARLHRQAHVGLDVGAHVLCLRCGRRPAIARALLHQRHQQQRAHSGVAARRCQHQCGAPSVRHQAEVGAHLEQRVDTFCVAAGRRRHERSDAAAVDLVELVDRRGREHQDHVGVAGARSAQQRRRAARAAEVGGGAAQQQRLDAAVVASACGDDERRVAHIVGHVGLGARR